ncbi:Alpha/Beta hydrolase protein [Trametes gibbosa]|nr:Alpha/Beta hydrolase protein [Trametes gibbosa]
MAATVLEHSFTLSFPDEDLELLRKRLELVRFPDELDEAGWEYGVPLADVRRLVEINVLPQFTRDVEVEGFGAVNVHYVHQRSAETKNAVPLLFIHGCGWRAVCIECKPRHFLEVKKLLPLRTAGSPDQPSFHVALSLPGKKGFASKRYAELANKLMIRLGYEQYGYLSTNCAHMHVKGWLSNYTKTKESGYWHEQSTRPQTLGYSLADSPTDEYPWTDDEVLEWVSVYWFSHAGPGASLRIYKEMTSEFERVAMGGVRWTSLPLGFAYFPKELNRVRRRYGGNIWLSTLGRVVFESEHLHGGYFAAHEQPAELGDDIRRMFGKGGPGFGVVAGKSG